MPRPIHAAKQACSVAQALAASGAHASISACLTHTIEQAEPAPTWLWQPPLQSAAAALNLHCKRSSHARRALREQAAAHKAAAFGNARQRRFAAADSTAKLPLACERKMPNSSLTSRELHAGLSDGGTHVWPPAKVVVQAQRGASSQSKELHGENQMLLRGKRNAAGWAAQQPRCVSLQPPRPAPAASLLAGVLFEGDAQHTRHLGQDLQEEARNTEVMRNRPFGQQRNPQVAGRRKAAAA